MFIMAFKYKRDLLITQCIAQNKSANKNTSYWLQDLLES